MRCSGLKSQIPVSRGQKLGKPTLENLKNKSGEISLLVHLKVGTFFSVYTCVCARTKTLTGLLAISGFTGEASEGCLAVV